MDSFIYRAKDKDTDQWVYGYYVSCLDYLSEIKKDVIFESDCLFFGSGETEGYYEIKPETLCRCTGARDCNGNYIFENDILLEHDIYRYKCYWDDKRCEFRLKAVGYSLSMSVLEERRIEIIGKTIENSNLYYKEDAPLNKHSEIVDVHTCNYRHNSNSRDNELCCRCDSRQTNADRIRNMSDEELV